MQPTKTISLFAPLIVLLAASPALARYTFPSNKQGVTDYMYLPSDGVSMQQRYAMLNNLGLGIKIYNLFWSAIENTVPSSTSPLSCPGGTVMVPGSADELQAQGYHQYHCYNTGSIGMFDTLLQLDQQYNFQSAAVIWSAPDFYRAAGCVGFDNGGYTEYGGCAPNDGVMDQYEDYINFLASRYNGGSNGKLYHFIIWNEVASGAWFDYSPNIDTTNPVTDPAVQGKWIDKYVDMLTRSRRAVDRHTPDSLVEVSLDLLFQSGGMNSGKAHIGGKTVLDGIWSRVGTNYDWSIAIHPYGDPADQDQGPNNIDFFGLRYLTQYQEQQLNAHGVSDTGNAPQNWMLASEQGWFDTPLDSRALNMCKAHNIIMAMPNVIGTTHNYFQADSADQDGIGLIPFEAGPAISNGDQYPTYRAYVSTGPQYWGVRNDHYCCETAQLGCAGAQPTQPSQPPASAPAAGHNVTGVIDGIENAAGRTMLGGWACDVGSLTSINVDLYAYGQAGSGQGVGRFVANLPSEPAVASICGTNGAAYRFQIDLGPYRAAFAGAPLYVHGISTSGGANNLLNNSGQFNMPSP